MRPLPISTLFPTRRSSDLLRRYPARARTGDSPLARAGAADGTARPLREDRKSTRLNSSHVEISYAVFCLKKKNTTKNQSQVQLEFQILLVNTTRLITVFID